MDGSADPHRARERHHRLAGHDVTADGAFAGARPGGRPGVMLIPHRTPDAEETRGRLVGLVGRGRLRGLPDGCFTTRL